MSNTHHIAGRYTRQNESTDEKRGNFCSPNRVKTVEGTRPQSRSRAVSGPVLDQAQPGNIHRDSRGDVWEAHDLNHEAWTTVHRPEPTDLGQLKSHQQEMLTRRQRAKNRSSKGRQA